MDLPPFSLEHVISFLRRGDTGAPVDEARVLEAARRMPRAGSPDALYLDVGGAPEVMHALGRLGGYRAVFGLCWEPGFEGDLREVEVEEPSPARESFRYRVLNVDFQQEPLPFQDGSVAVISCLEVLQRVDNPLRLLGELNRVLEDGGHLLLSAPNTVSWAAALRASRLESPLCAPDATGASPAGYPPLLLRALLRAAGFEGAVVTLDARSPPAPGDVHRLVAAGFTDFDRGDSIVAAMRKSGAPAPRFDPAPFRHEGPAAARAGGR